METGPEAVLVLGWSWGWDGCEGIVGTEPAFADIDVDVDFAAPAASEVEGIKTALGIFPLTLPLTLVWRLGLG